MALVKCRVCGKEISTTAVTCPHCGHRTVTASYEVEKAALSRRWGVGIALTVVGFVLLLVYGGDFWETFDWLGFDIFKL